MARESFLVVSLKESKTKKLAQAITNDTSLKILDYLANNERATETELARALKAPISTIHYNLQALLDTKMVKWNEFHYSEKGKEVKHYTLANKYILIAPAHDTGIRDRLKSILPISAIILAATAVIQFASKNNTLSRLAAPAAKGGANVFMEWAAEPGVADSASTVLASATPAAQEAATSFFAMLGQSFAFWFALGAFSALILYLIISSIRDRKG